MAAQNTIELRRQVFDYSRGKVTRDLGRIRIASKAVHESMMGMELDLRKWGFHSPTPAKANLATRAK